MALPFPSLAPGQGEVVMAVACDGDLVLICSHRQAADSLEVGALEQENEDLRVSLWVGCGIPDSLPMPRMQTQLRMMRGSMETLLKSSPSYQHLHTRSL